VVVANLIPLVYLDEFLVGVQGQLLYHALQDVLHPGPLYLLPFAQNNTAFK
jgi:hypothetical protein